MRKNFSIITRKELLTALILSVVFICFCSTSAFAVTGDGVFTQAARNILCEVMKKDFGAMITALAGLLAIIAAAAGSFKGAWALLFVSVGTFISDALVGFLFPGINC
jgi:hypothetical protein